jgi:hypothetical protein
LPDTIGFALASAFLASVFTIFGIIDRLVAGAAAEIRYSVAPAMVSGVRAWRTEPPLERPVSPGADEDRDSSIDAGDDGDVPGHRPPDLVVPVTTIPRRSWHLFGRVMRVLLDTRRRLTGRRSGPDRASLVA